MGGFRSLQAENGVHGHSLGDKFGIEAAPSIVTRVLGKAEIAVTDMRVNKPTQELSAPLPCLDGYIICSMISDLPENHYWEGGREVSTYDVRAGEITIHHLKREPRILLKNPYHTVFFYLPGTTLHALADQSGLPRISELQKNAVPISDETIHHLTLSLMPAFRAPEQVSRLFMDHVTLAFASHTAHRYGGLNTLSKLHKGGLAPWQERLSTDMIAGDLTGETPLRDIASACGLSASHFSRAFRKSMGVAPHAWLQQARIESAKAMLRNRKEPLSVIARACGFADRSHLTRVFSRSVGLSPAAWRRLSQG